MKRLWQWISPCMSDVMGFQAVVANTDGLGIVDDSSTYKPMHYEREKMQGRPHERGGHHGKGGHFGNLRVISSHIEETDVIQGTADKLMQAAANGVEQFHPSFVLLTSAPCASMIGTDLASIADEICQKYQVPAGVVSLDGQKDYLYGISHTLEAMAKLLLAKKETIPGTVNLLGCHPVDWSEEMTDKTKHWLESQGLQVISCWGAKTNAACLQEASAASVNLVVNISGLRVAKYMKEQFDIPYVVGAPFGKAYCEDLLAQLQSLTSENITCSPERIDQTEVFVIGEQLQANAIRFALQKRGFKNICVCSFFEMDKALMAGADKKLVSEDEWINLLKSSQLQLVIGDMDYRIGTEIPWIALANQSSYGPSERLSPFSMTSEDLDQWLDNNLNQLNLK